eukprot:sb/3469350/
MKTTKDKLVALINKLLTAGKIDLKTQGSILIYQLKAGGPTTSASTKGMGQEEKIVFKIIEEAGNKGIWVKDIRFKSNLQLTQLNKVLKVLESKKTIKSVRPVNDSKKKVYMLFDTKPDSSLTGGAWYSESDFETEFVDILGRQTLTYLQVELEEEEVKQILESLVFDGFVCRTYTLGEGGKRMTFYRAIKHQPLTSGVSRVPCGVCPLTTQCTPGGLVSPSSCKYMKEWLEF